MTDSTPDVEPSYVLADWSKIREEWGARTLYGKFVFTPVVLGAAFMDLIFAFVFIALALKHVFGPNIYKNGGEGE